jgi:hypothetical protein
VRFLPHSKVSEVLHVASSEGGRRGASSMHDFRADG